MSYCIYFSDPGYDYRKARDVNGRVMTFGSREAAEKAMEELEKYGDIYTDFKIEREP